MPLLDVFWSMLWLFLFLAWFWLVILVFADIVRSDDLSGWGKAGWVILTVVLPYLGVFTYLVARGGTMVERSARRDSEAERARRGHHETAGTTASASNQLTALAELYQRGTLTEDEFKREKARILTS